MPVLEWVAENSFWPLMVLFGSQALIFVVVVGMMIWHDAVRPWLIPAAEIRRAADEIMAHFPDPDAEIGLRLQKAWARGSSAEQVYWRRVRKVIRQGPL